MLEDPLANRPEEEALEPAHAASAHDKQVGTAACLEQGPGWEVADDMLLDRTGWGESIDAGP
jgi:hypothetical protein